MGAVINKKNRKGGRHVTLCVMSNPVCCTCSAPVWSNLFVSLQALAAAAKPALLHPQNEENSAGEISAHFGLPRSQISHLLWHNLWKHLPCGHYLGAGALNRGKMNIESVSSQSSIHTSSALQIITWPPALCTFLPPLLFWLRLFLDFCFVLFW